MAHNLKKWRKLFNLYFHRIILCLCKGLLTNEIPSWPSGLVIKRKLTVVGFSLTKVGGFVDFKSWECKGVTTKIIRIQSIFSVFNSLNSSNNWVQDYMNFTFDLFNCFVLLLFILMCWWESIKNYLMQQSVILMCYIILWFTPSQQSAVLVLCLLWNRKNKMKTFWSSGSLC